MDKITMKAYAVKHKLSIFNVMKMVKSGKVKSEVFEENGKEVTYIVLDDITEAEVRDGIVYKDERNDSTLEEEMKRLKKEVSVLRDEFDALKKQLNK
ncbi:MAG TPA: hypothetical protein EYG82_06995 [Sulfurovum sp.]|nr:hypothetical protein [Sulfurovum sp.]